MAASLSSAIAKRLEEFSEETDNFRSGYEIQRWSTKVAAFLNTAMGPDETELFASLTDSDEWHQLALQVGHLQGLVAKSEATREPSAERVQKFAPVSTTSSRKVFVVHGHDNEAKETAARFLEKLGLQPIILHEQPNSGRTIIEKFETYSDDIAFAVVLLTPDDAGSRKGATTTPRSRARQNVILELGYFMGRLGRSRVCALHKGGVELPSDYRA